MATTRRRILQGAAAVSGMAVMGSAAAVRGAEPGGRKKRALAILGDAWHCVAPLYTALVAPLKARGYASVTVMDYAAPFDAFGTYDLVILSRYAYNDIAFYREKDAGGPKKARTRWLTPEQEQKFEDYVTGGGRLLLHHDGIGFYAKDGAISRVARAFFIRHPPRVEIEISPTAAMPEMTRGVTPFRVTDEEYQVQMDESRTHVFLESHSAEHGRAPQGWAHTCGKGKVAVLIPGHSQAVLVQPMVGRLIRNVLDWLEAAS